MKLNQIQRYALLDWLSRNVRNFFHHGVIYEFDSFCNGDFTEWRVISDFGMAGKIWNNCDSIYITGYSRCEVSEATYKKQQEKIDKWNEEIAELIGVYN